MQGHLHLTEVGVEATLLSPNCPQSLGPASFSLSPFELPHWPQGKAQTCPPRTGRTTPARGPAGQLRGPLGTAPSSLRPRAHPVLSTPLPFGNLLRFEGSIGKGLKQPQKVNLGMDRRPLSDGEGPGRQSA